MSDCVWQIGCTYGLRFAKSQPKRIGRMRVFVENVKIMISTDLVTYFGQNFGVPVALAHNREAILVPQVTRGARLIK